MSTRNVFRELNNTTDDGPSSLNSLEAKISALKRFYAALDEVLFLIETPPGQRDLRKPIDFYDEVKNFEISLIRRALSQSSGSQLRAAALLNLNATTLNAKVKSYSINCKTYSIHPRETPGWSDQTEAEIQQ